MMVFAFTSVTSVSSNAAQSTQPEPLPIDECKIHAPFGFPTTKKKTVTKICREGYFTIHDNSAKIPLVSSYVLKPEHATGCEPRDNSFSVDRSLPPSFRAGNKDYAKSKSDIGHMVNAADLKYSPKAQATAALFSNAAPQLPGFNRGIWKKLEDTSRGWALSRIHDLQIYVGPIYDPKKDGTIGVGRVGNPHAFFKIITDMTTNESQVFIMNNEPSQQQFMSFITSLAEVQRRTGLVLPLPKEVKFTSEWPIELKSVSALKACPK